MQTNHKKQESFTCETRLWSVVTQRRKVPCFDSFLVVTDMLNFKLTSINICNKNKKIKSSVERMRMF